MTLPPDSPFDFRLTSGREAKPYGLILEKSAGAFTVGAVAQDDTVYVRNVGKRTGDFDEQRSWKQGRGHEKLSDNAEGFWDSQDAWTMTKGHACSGILWNFAWGLRTAKDNFINSKSWEKLQYIDTPQPASVEFYVSFTPDTTANYDKAQMWIRYKGDENADDDLTFTLYTDSGGNPNTTLKSVTISPSDIDVNLSHLYTFDWTGTQSLTAGTTYWIGLQAYGASNWEIAVDQSGTGKMLFTGGNFSAIGFALLYRITVADVNRKFMPFFLDDHLYVVDAKDDGSTASQLYINGDRGQATGGSTTTLVDTAFGCRAAAWSDNVLAGAMIRFKRNGRWYYAEIASHTGDTYTFVSATEIAPAATNPYFIYSTKYWTELTTSGLGVVTGEPSVFGQNVYFPQGDSTVIRCMATDFTAATNHKYRAESTYATFLKVQKGGTQIWKANNDTVAVAYSAVKAYGTDLSWGTAITIGDTTSPITGLNIKDGSLWVFKEDGKGTVSNNIYASIDSGEDQTPDPANGKASVVVDKFMYHSWLHSVIRVFGSSHDDIGQEYSSRGLPADREGDISYLASYITTMLAAVDARTGTSSVLMWDGLGWHELLRAYEANKRIRMVKTQPNQLAANIVWTQVGDDLVYQKMPYKKSSPLLDSNALYQHESVIVSSVIDMGAASNLPKFIKSITVTVKNLASNTNKSGNTTATECWLDYQTNDNCLTDNWTRAGKLSQSPESTVALNLSNINMFMYRLVMRTDDSSVPVDVTGVVPNGYARTPLKQMWTMRVKSGGIYQSSSQQTQDSKTLWRWLMDNARFPYSVFMESKYDYADGYNVIIHPPRVFPYKPPRPGVPGEAYMTLILEEV